MNLQAKFSLYLKHVERVWEWENNLFFFFMIWERHKRHGKCSTFTEQKFTKRDESWLFLTILTWFCHKIIVKYLSSRQQSILFLTNIKHFERFCMIACLLKCLLTHFSVDIFSIAYSLWMDLWRNVILPWFLSIGLLTQREQNNAKAAYVDKFWSIVLVYKWWGKEILFVLYIFSSIPRSF